jgi:hypothetical protein
MRGWNRLAPVRAASRCDGRRRRGDKHFRSRFRIAAQNQKLSFEETTSAYEARKFVARREVKQHPDCQGGIAGDQRDRACPLGERIADGKHMSASQGVLDILLRHPHCRVGEALQPKYTGQYGAGRHALVELEADAMLLVILRGTTVFLMRRCSESKLPRKIARTGSPGPSTSIVPCGTGLS